MPEDAGAFDSKVDDATDGAFHGAAADGQMQATGPRITEAVTIPFEVAAGSFQGFGSGAAGHEGMHVVQH